MQVYKVTTKTSDGTPKVYLETKEVADEAALQTFIATLDSDYEFEYELLHEWTCV